MTSLNIVFVYLFTFLYPLSLYSQISLSTSQTLPSLKRLSIETDHFRIIYPKSLSSRAKYVASSLEESFEPLQKSLDVKEEFHKIDIVLQNQSAISNGYVALSPFRSEWETLPALSNNLGSTNWLLTLSIHEQRHMHQFLQYKKGFAKWMRIFFGDFGTEVSIALSLPRWFFEGDATVEETLLTNSGRGRVADFSKTIRSMIYENNLESYTHVYNTSYEKNRPGPYELGYILNLSLRADYLDETFDRVVQNTIRNSYWPYKFEKNISIFTGKDMDEFYHNSVHNSFPTIKKGGNYLEDFLITGDSSVHDQISIEKLSKENQFLYYKSGFNETGGFYIYDSKMNQEKLLIRTNIDQENIRVRSSKFVYNDIDIHPRFSLVNYSNVYLYDLVKKKRFKITDRGQYLKSQLGHDQSQIATLYFDKKMSQYLKVLSINGDILASIKLDDMETVRHIEWRDEKNILVTGIDSRNMQFLRLINLTTEKIDELLSLDAEVINDVRSSANDIFFSSDYSGIDQIYKVLSQGRFEAYTDAPIAARYPNLIDGKLFYSSFKRDGFRVKAIDLKEVKSHRKRIHGISRLKKKSKNVVLSEVSTQNYVENEFDKKNFRLHSWSYLTSLLGGYNGTATITMSDNLNELNLSTGFINNFVEGATSYFASAAYQKYWPIFFATTTVGKRSVIVIDKREREQYDEVKWDQNTLKAGVTIPYSIVKNAKNYSFDLTSSAVYNKIKNKTYVDDFSNGEILGSNHALNFKFNTFRPYTRLFPEYLFTLSTEFAESITKSGDTNHAFLKYIGTNIGLPGFSKTASFIFKYDHQEKSVGDFNFTDKAFFARGYESLTSTRIDTASLNYSTALFYPDFNIFHILYLKRIRGNLFYDYTVADKDLIHRAYGLELSFDVSPLRFNSFELGLGLRFSYLDNYETLDKSVFLESLVGTF